LFEYLVDVFGAGILKGGHALGYLGKRVVNELFRIGQGQMTD